MSEPENHRKRHRVVASAAVRTMILRVQTQAERTGRGEHFLAALKDIFERLQQDPRDVGDPVYRLPALRLQVYTCVVRPLVVHFAVHDEVPLVFIKRVRLL